MSKFISFLNIDVSWIMMLKRPMAVWLYCVLILFDFIDAAIGWGLDTRMHYWNAIWPPIFALKRY